jgi:hypothetical protein
MAFEAWMPTGMQFQKLTEKLDDIILELEVFLEEAHEPQEKQEA